MAHCIFSCTARLSLAWKTCHTCGSIFTHLLPALQASSGANGGSQIGLLLRVLQLLPAAAGAGASQGALGSSRLPLPLPLPPALEWDVTAALAAVPAATWEAAAPQLFAMLAGG